MIFEAKRKSGDNAICYTSLRVSQNSTAFAFPFVICQLIRSGDFPANRKHTQSYYRRPIRSSSLGLTRSHYFHLGSCYRRKILSHRDTTSEDLELGKAINISIAYGMLTIPMSLALNSLELRNLILRQIAADTAMHVHTPRFSSSRRHSMCSKL